MLNPLRLCNDLFDDPALSDEGLQAFAEDALLRLTNNNPGGIYSLLISDTTIKYTAYYGQMTSQATQTAIREGLTIAKDNARTAAEHKVSSLEGLVRFKFGLASQTYQEFYPQGLTEYQNCSDAALEIKLDRFVGAATTHLTADHPAEVTAIGDLRTAFKNAHLAQNNAFSNIDNIITGKHVDRKALTVQLTKNFLTIAIDNIDNTDKYDDFFNPQLLPLRSGDNEDEGVFEDDIANAEIKNIDLQQTPLPDATPMEVEATGSELTFYSSATNNGTIGPSTPTLVVQPGTPHQTTVGAFKTLISINETTPFLMVQNTGGNPGHYKLTFDI